MPPATVQSLSCLSPVQQARPPSLSHDQAVTQPLSQINHNNYQNTPAETPLSPGCHCLASSVGSEVKSGPWTVEVQNIVMGGGRQ